MRRVPFLFVLGLLPAPLAAPPTRPPPPPVRAPRPAPAHAARTGAFAWSPDSSRIALAAPPSPLLASRSEPDLYLVAPAHPGQAKPIVALPGPEQDPVFSPDG